MPAPRARAPGDFGIYIIAPHVLYSRLLVARRAACLTHISRSRTQKRQMSRIRTAERRRAPRKPLYGRAPKPKGWWRRSAAGTRVARVPLLLLGPPAPGLLLLLAQLECRCCQPFWLFCRLRRLRRLRGRSRRWRWALHDKFVAALWTPNHGSLLLQTHTKRCVASWAREARGLGRRPGLPGLRRRVVLKRLGLQKVNGRLHKVVHLCVSGVRQCARPGARAPNQCKFLPF